jgi:Xaa-Pro aminopeptidase
MYNQDAARKMFSREGLDAVVACTLENVYYLSGFAPVVKVLNPYHGVCWVVVTAEAPGILHIVHSHGEADQILDASAELGLTELYGLFYRENPGGAELDDDESRLVAMAARSPMGRSPAEAIAAMIDKLGLAGARVAIDEDGVDRELAGTVASRFPEMKVQPGSDILRRLRRVKTAAEVARLAAAARCVEAAILSAAANAQVGMSECDLARHFEAGLLSGGARPSLTMLRTGRRAVFGQRRQDPDVRIQPDDVLWFDCDAVREMYWADVARVFVMGESSRHSQRFAALREGQMLGIDAVRPGMTGGQVFELVMDAVHRAGFPGYRRHHVGHGIGLEPYERPILAPGNTDAIETGMVLSIETPFYEYGLGALHLEDPILVGPNGNKRLTLFETGLNEI